MKIFAASLAAYRRKPGAVSFKQQVAVMAASSDEEAIGKGIVHFDKQFPRADNWQIDVSVMEITTDLIDELIKSQS